MAIFGFWSILDNDLSMNEANLRPGRGECDGMLTLFSSMALKNFHWQAFATAKLIFSPYARQP